MAADIVFNYTWLWGGYTADVTFTKKLLGSTPVSAAAVLEGAYKTIGSKVWSGTYTKKYNGQTTYDIIKQVRADIQKVSDSYAKRNFDSAGSAIEKAQKSSRAVNTSAEVEAVRQSNKAALAYMLTNFCGYKKSITLTSGLKGSLRAQTRRNGYFGSKKLITPGREAACDALDAAYRNKSQVYPPHKVLLGMIENKEVAGQFFNNKLEYNNIYSEGEREMWRIPTTGGTRKNRK